MMSSNDTNNNHLSIDIEEDKTSAYTKNSGYNWSYLLPAWSTVAAATVIVATKHLLDALEPTPAILIARRVIDTAYPGAFSYLAGVSATIGIDVVACLKNGPWYYKEGHNQDHVDLLPNDSSAIKWGVVWGIHASWKLAAIFAGAETVPSIVFSSLGKALPFTYLGYALLGMAAASIAGAHFYSEHAIKKEMEKSGSEIAYKAKLNNFFRSHITSKQDDISEVNLRNVPVDAREGYMNSGKMTQFGYFSLGLFAAPATLITSSVLGALDYHNIINLK